jgi:hypothetical protein
LANVLGFHGSGLDIWTGSWSNFTSLYRIVLLKAVNGKDVLLQDKAPTS